MGMKYASPVQFFIDKNNTRQPKSLPKDHLQTQYDQQNIWSFIAKSVLTPVGANDFFFSREWSSISSTHSIFTKIYN